MPRPFYLGLNMTGTVSAGAYTAGVIDFLVEAMDAWYAERERQAVRFGENYDQWTIPPHELQLAVMAGASGGGITGALAASALTQEFVHVRKQRTADNPALNLLFKSWVVDIDISRLLGHADLDANPGRVVSLLDSTPIQDIAQNAFATHNPLSTPRKWVRDGMRVILTLTNLRGTPYALEPQSDSDAARVLYFADRQSFAVTWEQPPSAGNVVWLDPRGGDNWSLLGSAAIATSAFPVVLAPERLRRRAGEYNHRTWRIAEDDPQCGPDGLCHCDKDEEMPPTYGLADDVAFDTLNVDGGTTNNSPFDCARLELANLDPKPPSGRNPRNPRYADRAVVNIAPLPLTLDPGLPEQPSEGLFSLPGQLVGVLLNQSRIQGENLRLTADPQVASRWAISPKSETLGAEALAGATMSAFGGFVSQVFREHDYQLGRRNCQRFLTSYFGVPWDNVVLQQYQVPAPVQSRLQAQYGMLAESNARTPLCPLIPIMPELRTEVEVQRTTLDRNALLPLSSLAMDRCRRVMRAFLSPPAHSFKSRAAFELAWLLVRNRMEARLLSYCGGELAKQGFID